MVVGNDPIVLSGTGFLVYVSAVPMLYTQVFYDPSCPQFTRVTGVSPAPWIIAQFAAANIGSCPTKLALSAVFMLNNCVSLSFGRTRLLKSNQSRPLLGLRNSLSELHGLGHSTLDRSHRRRLPCLVLDRVSRGHPKEHRRGRRRAWTGPGRSEGSVVR